MSIKYKQEHKMDIPKTPQRKNTHVKSDFPKIQDFLIKHANAIQKLATRHHKAYLGSKKFRSEFIDKYQKNHIKVVEEFAAHLKHTDIKKGLTTFKKLGEKLAKDSVKDGLTLEEAADGIIFLKQATWEVLKKHGLLDQLSIDEFYQINKSIGTYCDVVASKIAFTYHEEYSKNIEREIEERKKADRLKDEFISIASHELKTPITSLKANVQVLHHQLMQKEDIKSAEQLAKMDAQLTRMTNLIRDLLDMTKVEGGKLQLHPTYFDFNELVSEVVEETQQITKTHEIVKKLDRTCTVYADRERIGQVITNFVNNAIKYSPKANNIIVKTVFTKSNVTFCVHDFGIGISKRNQPRVFERFYQVDESTKESGLGLGLGLYISSEIITSQGGKIWVESIPGEGSTFCFTLLATKGKRAN